MTDRETPRSDDPLWVISQLRADADAFESEPDLSDQSTAAEAWAAEALTDPQISYSAVVLAAADELIPAVEVSTEARRRFITAAERALARRRADRGLLPVALTAARERAGFSVEDVQRRVPLSAPMRIADLEAGRVSLRDIEPEVTAAWIHAVRADRQLAVDAARRSLETVTPSELQLAAGSDPTGVSPDDWIGRLVAALDTLEAEEPGGDADAC